MKYQCNFKKLTSTNEHRHKNIKKVLLLRRRCAPPKSRIGLVLSRERAASDGKTRASQRCLPETGPWPLPGWTEKEEWRWTFHSPLNDDQNSDQSPSSIATAVAALDARATRGAAAMRGVACATRAWS